MLPLLMKVKIPREQKEPLTLYLPVFLVWLLFLILSLLLLPFLIIAAICTWQRGYGKIMLLALPMLFDLLWHLQGLVIDVENRSEKIFFQFI